MHFFIGIKIVQILTNTSLAYYNDKYNTMVIIETSIFTRQIQVLLSEEEYRKLQIEIIPHPDKGKLIPGSGGLRKIRWASDGRGKSGVLRTIYFWAVDEEQIFMLYIYSKKDQKDLTSDQLKVLCIIIKEEFK